MYGSSNMAGIWVAGNTFPSGTCDIYSTVSSGTYDTWITADAQVTTDAAADLCTTVLGVAGTQYPDSTESTLVSTVSTALGCTAAAPGSVRGAVIRGGVVK